MSLTASHGRSILSPHAAFRASIRRTATSSNLFVTAVFHSISLTARLMVLAKLSAATCFVPASTRKAALIWTYRDTDPLCFIQSAMDEAALCYDSATFRCRGQPLSGMCNFFFRSAHVIFLPRRLAPQSQVHRKKLCNTFCSYVSYFSYFSSSAPALYRRRWIRRWLRLFEGCY